MENSAVWGNPGPRTATLQCLCWSLEVSGLSWSAPDLTTWEKWPVRKCHCHASCWRLKNYGKLPTHWNMGGSSLATLCATLVFLPTLRTGFVRRHTAGIPAGFCYTRPRVQVSFLCMHFSQGIALNFYLFWTHLRYKLRILIYLFLERVKLLYVLFFWACIVDSLCSDHQGTIYPHARCGSHYLHCISIEN